MVLLLEQEPAGAEGEGAAADPARWARRQALRIIAAYVVATLAWVACADLLLAWVAPEPVSPAVETGLKAAVFLGMTALVLYGLLARVFADLQWSQRHLREMSDRFRRAMDEAPIPALIHAEDGSILLANRAWQEGTGYRPDELRTVRDWLDRAYGPRGAEVEESVRALYALEHRVAEGDFDVRVADGSTRTWSFSTGPVGRLPDGRREVLSMALDVTDRRRTEDALRASEQRFRTLVEAAPEAIFIMTDLKFAYVNPACVALLGARDADELLGLPVLERSPHAERAAVLDRIRAVTQERRPVGMREGVLRRLDGRGVEVEVTATPLPHEGRDGALVFLRDITARKAAKRELVQSAGRLRELSRRLLEVQEADRRELARELHDEIGQRLTAIMMNIHTAERRPESAAGRLDDARAILQETIDQVRNLALDLRPSLLDDFGLGVALRWYVERFRDRATMEGEFHADPPEPRVTPGVATACFRAVQEALTNVARHAGATGFRVRLQQRPDGELSLSIRDDGVGFDPAAAARRPGMGLDGMRERVQQAGGRVTIVAAPGAGTEIRLAFPAAATAGEAAPRACPWAPGAEPVGAGLAPASGLGAAPPVASGRIPEGLSG
jgi:PAS domain S-box-containing protein